MGETPQAHALAAGSAHRALIGKRLIRTREVGGQDARRADRPGDLSFSKQLYDSARTLLEEAFIEFRNTQAGRNGPCTADKGLATINRSVDDTVNGDAAACLFRCEHPERRARTAMGRQEGGMDVEHRRYGLEKRWP